MAAQSPSHDDPGQPQAEPPAKEQRRGFSLVVFSLAPGVQPHEGDALDDLVEMDHRTMAELHERGLRAASLPSDDGSWLMILDAPTIASLGDRFGDRSLFRHQDFRISAAEFSFTVGTVCDNAGGGAAKRLQMIRFDRDIAVLQHGGALAPTPFGAELGQLDEVVAAGAWGYGHIGFVFVDLPSPDDVNALLARFPVVVDPQWSTTVHTVTSTSDTFCE